MATEPAPYEKNTKEQYEALGRFVEAFEAMVNKVRNACIDLLAPDRRRQHLVEVALHHHALAAKPLCDIFRAVIIELIDDVVAVQNGRDDAYRGAPLMDRTGTPFRFTPKDRDAFMGVLSTIAQEYDALTNKRNSLLHATWFVGYSSADDPTCSEFVAQKFVLTKRGLSAAELPKNAGELKALSERCEATQGWISWLADCLTADTKIQERFEHHGDEWWLVTPGGSKTTLPQK
jgi:hypothetical protein